MEASLEAVMMINFAFMGEIDQFKLYTLYTLNTIIH